MDKIRQELFYLKENKARRDGLQRLGEDCHHEDIDKSKKSCELSIFYDLGRVRSALELYGVHSASEEEVEEVGRLLEKVEFLEQYIKNRLSK